MPICFDPREADRELRLFWERVDVVTLGCAGRGPVPVFLKRNHPERHAEDLRHFLGRLPLLGTFPIVKREEERRRGRFRSRDLILGYMAALAAGAADAKVAG